MSRSLRTADAALTAWTPPIPYAWVTAIRSSPRSTAKLRMRTSGLPGAGRFSHVLSGTAPVSTASTASHSSFTAVTMSTSTPSPSPFSSPMGGYGAPAARARSTIRSPKRAGPGSSGPRPHASRRQPRSAWASAGGPPRAQGRRRAAGVATSSPTDLNQGRGWARAAAVDEDTWSDQSAISGGSGGIAMRGEVGSASRRKSAPLNVASASATSCSAATRCRASKITPEESPRSVHRWSASS